jgi:hypothetical protein
MNLLPSIGWARSLTRLGLSGVTRNRRLLVTSV